MVHLAGSRGPLLVAVLCSIPVLIVFAGCNRSSQESQVSGRVTLDGKPIGPGTIAFGSVGTGKPATGSIDESGNYDMRTGREAGLGAGRYKVAVSIREVPQNMKRGDRPPPGKLLIPERYEESSTSGLEYNVEPGRNTINIELKSDQTGAPSPGPKPATTFENRP
jgi:hypothetical protein